MQQGGSRIRAHPPGSFRLADPVAFSRAGMLPVGGLPFALETWVCFPGSLESPPATCSEQPLCQRGPRRLQQPRSQGCPQARLAHIRGLETGPTAVIYLPPDPQHTGAQWCADQKQGSDCHRARGPQGTASLCQRGKTPTFHSHRASPSPVEHPMAPAASQGHSHSSNTVSHCCRPWQAQSSPQVPG